MKKTLVSLLYLLITVSLLFFFCTDSSIGNPDRYSVINSNEIPQDNKFDDLFELPLECQYETVYKNYLPFKFEKRCNTKVEKCSFVLNDYDCKGGDILSSGFCANGVTYQSKIRINQYDGHIVYGDLIDTTSISFYLDNVPIPLDIASLKIKTFFLEKEIEVKSIESKYNNGKFEVLAYIDNGGEIFLNQIINASISIKSCSLSGMYVYKKAIFSNYDELYLKQISYYQKKEYWKKIPIKVVDTIGNICKIESSENLENIMICY